MPAADHEPPERELSGAERRGRLADARLMLLFIPELCRGEPLEVLARALPHLDAIQVRIKDAETGTTPARATFDWTLRVLRLVREQDSRALVLVNDRVDVARALASFGLDGVHLGQEDAPPELARALLGPEVLLGFSTHSAADVARAEELPVDYLGFGPVHPTSTKGYAHGLGCEAAWIAAGAATRPVFPIGGIDATNAQDLARVGRAAVGRAILAADDPARAAAEIAALLRAEE